MGKVTTELVKANTYDGINHKNTAANQIIEYGCCKISFISLTCPSERHEKLEGQMDGDLY